VGRVPLGVGVLFGGAVVTFLKRYFGLFFLGAVLGMSLGFEAYCVLLCYVRLGPSVIESKEAAGFDDMYWLCLMVPSLLAGIVAATVGVLPTAKAMAFNDTLRCAASSVGGGLGTRKPPPLPPFPAASNLDLLGWCSGVVVSVDLLWSRYQGGRFVLDPAMTNLDVLGGGWSWALVLSALVLALISAWLQRREGALHRRKQAYGELGRSSGYLPDDALYDYGEIRPLSWTPFRAGYSQYSSVQ